MDYEQRVIELQVEVDGIVAQIQHLKANPPADVAAAQARVDAAIAELRAEKSKPTTWHRRTSDMYQQLRDHMALEETVRSAKRNRVIVGRAFDCEVAALGRKLYETRRYLEIAIERQQTGGTFMFSA